MLPDTALLIARFTTPEGEQLEAVQAVKLNPDESLALGETPPILQISGTDESRPVSTGQESMTDEELSRDLPDEFPTRAPADTTRGNTRGRSRDLTNPFAEIMKKQPTETSDVWTDQTIPTLR